MVDQELEQKLLEETDLLKVDDIIKTFNLYIKKRDVVRANKLSELQDKISEQIQKRVETRADEFSNKDLLEYFKAVQDILDNSDNSTDSQSPPAIHLNQQNISVEVTPNGLDKNSRDNVINAVQALLSKYGKLDAVNVDTVNAVEEAVNVVEETEEKNAGLEHDT